MAQTIVIDIMARMQDRTSQGVAKAKSNVDKLGNSIKKMQAQLAKINGGSSNIHLGVRDEATKAIEKTAKTMGN